MIQNNYCVIMAGGIGSRFWPMSRNAHPKQFIDILGSGKTLIRRRHERFKGICPLKTLRHRQRQLHRPGQKQLPELAATQIIAEPQAAKHGTCVAYSAFKIFAMNPEANIVVAPSDHIVSDEASFQKPS
jgi:mannose-1-phosphate guanylyltransferase